MDTIRLMIADDHQLFREGIKALLASIGSAEVIAEAANGIEAVQQALEHGPDVILMDIQMPETNGVDATRKIVEANPRIGIIMLSMYDDDASVFTAMRAGARGYILKGADQGELMRAVEAAANGEALFSPSIAARLIRFFGNPRPNLPVDAFPDLTVRERELLDLIAQGQNNHAIARRLEISGKTVRNHVSNIFSKLQVADRAEAIVRAREAGYGHNP
jgi:DNA-binding NarL/FixJ family response regulator